MLLLLSLPIGVILGYLTGGRLSGIGKLNLRWLVLVLASLILQLLIFPSFFETAILPYATATLHLVSYALLLIWILRNARIAPVLGLGIGATCNFIALFANGGYMPASSTALERAGHLATASILQQQGTYSNLVLMTAETRVNFLGDILFVPEWIPFSAAFSIGDLLIALAIVWLIAKGMRIDARHTRRAA